MQPQFDDREPVTPYGLADPDVAAVVADDVDVAGIDHADVAAAVFDGHRAGDVDEAHVTATVDDVDVAVAVGDADVTAFVGQSQVTADPGDGDVTGVVVDPYVPGDVEDRQVTGAVDELEAAHAVDHDVARSVVQLEGEIAGHVHRDVDRVALGRRAELGHEAAGRLVDLVDADLQVVGDTTVRALVLAGRAVDFDLHEDVVAVFTLDHEIAGGVVEQQALGVGGQGQGAFDLGNDVVVAAGGEEGQAEEGEQESGDGSHVCSNTGPRRVCHPDSSFAPCGALRVAIRRLRCKPLRGGSHGARRDTWTAVALPLHHPRTMHGLCVLPPLTLALAAVVLPACGDHDDASDLSMDSVTEIPEGDARGTDRSGTYQVDIYTSHCEGSCLAVADWWTASFCDVGDRDLESFDATQRDGALQIDGSDDNYVSRYEGGIDGDGTFEVGGYGTEGGGVMKSTARVEGEIADDGHIEAVAEIHVWGSYDGVAVDCYATYEVEGDRLGGASDDSDE